MATKPESKDAAAVAVAATEKPAAAEKAAPAEKSAARGFNLKAWIPAFAVILIAPAASWAVTQFVLLPRLEKKLSIVATPADGAASSAAAPAETAAPAAEEKKDAKGAPIAPPTYKFDNMVVNLAGTMGTRYLKTTFIVTGTDPKLPTEFEDHKAQLTDVTLNVLSSLTLADLEEPGSKNVLREKLVNAYNQSFAAAGIDRKVAEQVWFSDFVVQ